jgi:toxin HigB-1
MVILFKESKFRKQCADIALLTRAQGVRQAALIRARLDALYRAKSLEDLRHIPGRLHELVGNRKGQFSLDLVHPDRLLFTAGPADSWSQITTVTIIGIVDTHD